ncbi:MAG: hypothetical protein GXP35_08780 [Actinobacteria bacterium]|nr:hypothetical protein [Actinomycetota bacterium]
MPSTDSRTLSGKLVALLITMGIVATACSNGIPVSNLEAFEGPIDSVEELAAGTDAVIHGRLVAAGDHVRYTDGLEGEATEGFANEFVALVFEVISVESGSIGGAKQVTVEWLAYEVDSRDHERKTEVHINGIDFLDRVGDEFLVPIVFSSELDGYRVFSTRALASVDEQGRLTGLADSYRLDQLELFNVTDIGREAALRGD